MQALLAYWRSAPSFDAATGLSTWLNGLQSGSDDLVTWECPGDRYSCWVPSMANTVGSPDIMVFLYREFQALAQFCTKWAADEQDPTEKARLLQAASDAKASAAIVSATINKYLWKDDLGVFVAYNVSTRQQVLNRVYLMGVSLLLQDHLRINAGSPPHLPLKLIFLAPSRKYTTPFATYF